MSIQSHSMGSGQQDKTLSDLLETYRHIQSDDGIPEERRRRATERMKPVWAKLAKLQDPDGFINHLTEYVQREYQRRNHADKLPDDVDARTAPMCRCDQTKHVCEVKMGELPSKIRTLDLKYVHTESPRKLARDYVQEHSGDVVIREAMEAYRNLRAEIYAELSKINAMMLGADEVDGVEDADGGEGGASGAEVQPGPMTDGTDHATGAAADGGPQNPLEATIAAVEDGEVSGEDIQAVADGDKTLDELDVNLEMDGDGSEVA